MKDVYWTLLRQLLLVVSAPLAAKYGVDAATSGALIDAFIAVGMSSVTAGTMAWGLYIRKGTVAVSETTGARKDVPTVSAATGAIERTSK
jgi:hypothetical protein